MAIYHFSAGFVSRSTGRSAVQSAAYITGTSLHESRRNITADYTKRSDDVVFSKTLAPQGAPSWMKSLEIWDHLENVEDDYANAHFKSIDAKRKYLESAQTAQTIVVALPKELELDDQKKLVIQFAQENFISRDLIVSLAIHHDENNPHAHFMISRRAFVLPEKDSSVDGKKPSHIGLFSWKKDREIVTLSSLLKLRKSWAQHTNDLLEERGFAARVDHRSFKDQGLLVVPTQKEGWYARQLLDEGKESRIRHENVDIAEKNTKLFMENPEALLAYVGAHYSTFSQKEVVALLKRKVSRSDLIDSVDINRMAHECLKLAVVVGEGFAGEERYATHDNIVREAEMMRMIEDRLSSSHPMIDQGVQEKAHEIVQDKYPDLTAEQRHSIDMLCTDRGVSVLIGRAGTGKTTRSLKIVTEAYQSMGYRVMGMSLSAVAAENLEIEAGCDSRTIAHYLRIWESYDELYQKFYSLHGLYEHHFLEAQLKGLEKHLPDQKTVLILDEAGMVGTPSWHKIMGYVNRTGAKLIAVGDDNQFKPIEVGDVFRKVSLLAQDHGALATLKQIKRQRESWMCEASVKFSEFKTYSALSDYESRGFVKTTDQNYQSLIDDYCRDLADHPTASRLMLASTRLQCATLNKGVQERLIAAGLISHMTKVGNQKYGVGDSIVFLKNDHEQLIASYHPDTQSVLTFKIKNGTRGHIVDIINQEDGNHEFVVELNKDHHVRFSPQVYKDINHGYALTLHKSQGQTVDRVFVLAGKLMDAYATYVGMTRHRDVANLYYCADEFKGFGDFQRSLSRLGVKDLVSDYHISDENRLIWSDVKLYCSLTQQKIAAYREKDWSTYKKLSRHVQEMSRHMLDDWSNYSPFLQMAQISQESLEIESGLRIRPRSQMEIKAAKIGLAYRHKSDEVRLLWHQIRTQNQGYQTKSHARYAEFDDLRRDRDRLAFEIVHFPEGGYKAVVRALEHGLSRCEKTLIKQANDHAERLVLERQAFESKSLDKEIIQSRVKKVLNKDAQKAFYHKIHQELNDNIEDVALHFLGNPTSKNAHQWRYGKKGSLLINVRGKNRGLYTNFETGQSGKALKFVEEQLGCSRTASMRWALDWLGYDALTYKNQFMDDVSLNKAPQREVTSNKVSDEWTPVFPVPDSAPEPDLQNKYLKKDLQETRRFAYRNAKGQLLGYVVRLEDEAGHKQTLPLTYWEHQKGFNAWRWKGFVGDVKTLYGLEKLSQNPLKPVLIVEGEKAADIAQQKLHEYVVISWIGGAKNYAKTDWTPVIGRHIVIWPDNDAVGLSAAQNIQGHLKTLHAQQHQEANVHIVNLPENTPEKWDLADPLPDTWNIDTVHKLLNNSLNEISLITEITETMSRFKFDSIEELPKKEVAEFVSKSMAYFKTFSPNMPQDEKLARSCYMLDNISRVETLVSLNSKRGMEIDPVRALVTASHIWFEGTQDRTKAKSDPLWVAMKVVKIQQEKHHDQIQSLRDSHPHLPKEKMNYISDHILRHQEVTGEKLDDKSVYELANDIKKEIELSQTKILADHHVQTRQINGIMRKLQHDQQIHQQLMQLRKSHELSL